ncbi:transcriptional regulator [Vibrio sp. 10N.286.49.B3]|uniref:HlyU family transcriptional regulator n=1 Tax=Vibrio sp. 10N.286.49.B3 TaxID=1880855 RepID=UPI000C81EA1A|nr:HlyU family transcriptional regulator [Vibrio sp. 10N.286.49.B3]PMH43800.1 transcriptional regulator [Vibrio sp. 10N.286.49.B3]
MGFFSRLFGKKDEKAVTEITPVEYKGCLIYQDSLPEGGQYRIAGRITKEIDGELKEHRFIRSDVISAKDDANELMLKKSQMLIDQMGDSIFQ